MKEGKIIRKWSVNNLPDEYELTEPLNRLSIGYVDNRSLMLQVLLVVAWFVFPLFFICLSDLMWERYKKRQRLLEKE